MARRRRFVWAWWVGGIVLALFVLAIFDYKIALPLLFHQAMERALTPGSTATVAAPVVPCFKTSVDAGAFSEAFARHDSGAETKTLRNTYRLAAKTHLSAISYGGSHGAIWVRVLDGPFEGAKCWILDGALMADVVRSSSTGESCIDATKIKAVVADLKQIDQLSDQHEKRSLFERTNQIVGRMNSEAHCVDGTVPPDFLVANSWATADSITVEPPLDPSDGCEVVTQRTNMAAAWLTVYDQQLVADPDVVRGAETALGNSASALSMRLPPYSVGESAAFKFESDTYANATNDGC